MEAIVTELLQRAFHLVSQLPTEEQDAIAAQLIEEIEIEVRWDASFARSHDILEQMADEAIREHRAGLTLPLDCDRE
jgi:hypothetical protein